MATYEVRLYLNGALIGDVRPLAQGLTWTRRRTKAGADEIDFTINDVLFNEWCKARNVELATMLKPLALECRVYRDGVAVVGGFLATMPGYSPNGTSANLAMRFDGYLNLLDGVYITPIGTVTGKMGALVRRFITEADARALAGGKAFGFTVGSVSDMSSVEHTFDNYKSTKEWICDRCDNTSGAGPFDVYFHADKTFDVVKDSEFGDVIGDWSASYPTRLNGASATSISAPEVDGFASRVIGIGAGEVSSEADKNTAIISTAISRSAVLEYGYRETIMQDSDISVMETLEQKTKTQLAIDSKILWEPEIVMSGTGVNPTPSGNSKIWIGDTITISNLQDFTGMTNGQFRVNELAVAVSANGGENITPVLERV